MFAVGDKVRVLFVGSRSETKHAGREGVVTNLDAYERHGWYDVHFEPPLGYTADALLNDDEIEAVDTASTI